MIRPILDMKLGKFTMFLCLLQDAKQRCHDKAVIEDKAGKQLNYKPIIL